MTESLPTRPLDLTPALATALAERSDRRQGFGEPLARYESVGSTNDVAGSLALAGARHGTVVVATFQAHGRGRMGHDWFSPPGAGLYVSVVLRPAALAAPGRRSPDAQSATIASSVTLTAGVALADAARNVTGLPVEIKWPNDLVIDRRKVCGILAEGSATADGLEHVILGFGLNVRETELPPDLLGRATSLEGELGRPVDENELLAEALACLAERLRSLRTGGFEEVLSRWRELSPSSTGAWVDVKNTGGEWRAARTAGIDTDGALLAKLDGTTRRVIAGEIRWH